MKPAPAPTALDALEADLLAGGIATRVLEAWSGGPVRAEVARGVAVGPGPARCARLGVAGAADVGFRRVRLMRGNVVLSQADNWYVTGALTPDMHSLLDASERPFGVVIAPLDPHRRTIASERLGHDPVLRVQALVLASDGSPLAEVIETYTRAALG